MTLASIGLLALVATLLVFDFVALRKGGTKILILEIAAFFGAGILIVRPEFANWVAHKVGIWRGVDFVIYPLVVWLFRESLLSRHARWREADRVTRLVQSLAVRDAVDLSAAPPAAVARPRRILRRLPLRGRTRAGAVSA